MKPGSHKENDWHILLLKLFYIFHSTKDTILKIQKTGNRLEENIYNP